MRIKDVLINRDFACLWAGESISLIGDFLFSTTITLWVANLVQGRTWAALALSGVPIAITIPMLCVSPVAGVFVDRWDTRKTMLAMNALRALIICGLLVAIGLLPLAFPDSSERRLYWQLGIIYLSTTLITAGSQFFMPSRFALIRDIVPETQRAQALGQIETITNAAVILGPLLAAPLYLWLGPLGAIGLNGASFLASSLALLAVRVPPQAPNKGQAPHFWHELGEGLSIFHTQPVLRTLLLSTIIFMLGEGAFNSLIILCISQHLHLSQVDTNSLYALLISIYGIGAVIGSLLSGLLAKRLSLVQSYGVSIVLYGVLVFGLGYRVDEVSLCLCMLLLGIVSPAIRIASGTLQLQILPRELIGRVSSVSMSLARLASLLSTSLAGILLSTILSNAHLHLTGNSLDAISIIYAGAAILDLLAGAYALLRLPPILHQGTVINSKKKERVFVEK